MSIDFAADLIRHRFWRIADFCAVSNRCGCRGVRMKYCNRPQEQCTAATPCFSCRKRGVQLASQRHSLRSSHHLRTQTRAQRQLAQMLDEGFRAAWSDDHV